MMEVQSASETPCSVATTRHVQYLGPVQQHRRNSHPVGRRDFRSGTFYKQISLYLFFLLNEKKICCAYCSYPLSSSILNMLRNSVNKTVLRIRKPMTVFLTMSGNFVLLGLSFEIVDRFLVCWEGGNLSSPGAEFWPSPAMTIGDYASV
jgi:hypothetical protein